MTSEIFENQAAEYRKIALLIDKFPAYPASLKKNIKKVYYKKIVLQKSINELEMKNRYKFER